MTTHSEAIRSAVANLYDTYPFPPEPLLDEPPPGYNWRWNWIAAYNFCTGRKPDRLDIRILDAGCGTGVGTEYLVHLNPEARVWGIDISAGAIAVATERCRRSGADRVAFSQLELEAATELKPDFHYINCVGVLHHLPDPIRGIQALAKKLVPGGLMHIFVYGELGRWEIKLMQQAIALLQGGDRGDYREGVRLGRALFANLPESNRLLKRERERWALDNQRDATFADMYVHPQEIDYNIDTLFELIDASGLSFVGFSNPQFWQLDRLLGGNAELLAKASQLQERDRYRLIELLDPEVTHYEFFLAKPPLVRSDWSQEADLLAAIPERHPCIEGWESQKLFNYDYQWVELSEAEFAFLKACDANMEGRSLREILQVAPLELTSVRSLLDRQLLVLSPGQP